MIHLLDVNVLIALLDPAHLFHDAAHLWWQKQTPLRWATCPLTENAVVRICSHLSYGNRPGNASVVAELLRQLITLGDHRFWHDRISLLDASQVDLTQITNPGELTDIYLLALAASHGGVLATFDHKLRPQAALAGSGSLCLLDRP